MTLRTWHLFREASYDLPTDVDRTGTGCTLSRVDTRDPIFELPAPSVTPKLDPLFRPAALAWRAFRQRARDSGRSMLARFALEQKDGAVSRFESELFPDDQLGADQNFRMLERLVKLALWS